MLKLRRATVVRAEPPSGSEQRIVTVIGDEWREAIADVGLVGESQVGDELVVNTEARDLQLGSGGFDVVHANLTRGLEGEGTAGAHVMKLNYTSLQHAVVPVESDEEIGVPLRRPVAVIALHGQLAPLVWSFAQRQPQARLGYVQTAGGALPGGHSRVVRELLERGLLCDHVTAGPAFGGGAEAISVAGAIHHGLTRLGWHGVVCGPGPGIVGSSSALGHGGMAALDSAHSAMALGCPAVLVARMSTGDARPRHQGISHHTLTVLDLLLEPVTVALPAGLRTPIAADLRAGLRGAFAGQPQRDGAERAGGGLDVARPARIARHDWRRVPIDLVGYGSSGLPAETMGRSLAQDPLFFGSALAAGGALAAFAGAPGPRPTVLSADEDDDELGESDDE